MSGVLTAGNVPGAARGLRLSVAALLLLGVCQAASPVALRPVAAVVSPSATAIAVAPTVRPSPTTAVVPPWPSGPVATVYPGPPTPSRSATPPGYPWPDGCQGVAGEAAGLAPGRGDLGARGAQRAHHAAATHDHAAFYENAAASPDASSSPSNPPTPSPSHSAPPATPSPRPTPTPRASPTAPSGPAAPLVYSGPTRDPLVAITIDDGYSPSVVRCELAVLRAEHVNATFFPIGQAVSASPALWHDVAAAGFPVGNHTWSHPLLTKVTYDEALAEIRRGNEAVAAAIGRAPVSLLRPPGGATNQSVLVAAHAAGESAVVNWDTTLGDTGRGPVSQLLINGERGHNGSIILMHGSDPRSAQALPALIAFYRAAGFRFVTVGQLIGVPGPVPFPSPLGDASLGDAAPTASVAGSTVPAPGDPLEPARATLTACARSSCSGRRRSTRRRSASSNSPTPTRVRAKFASA